MRSATWRPPMPHHFHSSFFQSWPSTESDLRYSNVSGKMPFQNFSLPFHLSLLSSHFAFAGRPPPLQLVPPSTLTWQPQTQLPKRQWREPTYRWINLSNIFHLVKSTYLLLDYTVPSYNQFPNCLSLTSFLTSKWSARLIGLSHIPLGEILILSYIIFMLSQDYSYGLIGLFLCSCKTILVLS